MSKPTPEAITYAGVLYAAVVAGKSIGRDELDLMHRLFRSSITDMLPWMNRRQLEDTARDLKIQVSRYPTKSRLIDAIRRKRLQV